MEDTIPKSGESSPGSAGIEHHIRIPINWRGPAHPAKGNIDLFIVTEDGETAAYLQKVKDEEGIMFDLSKVSSLDEIKATVAFLKTLRGEGKDQ
jgi:hypothetical protein